MAVQKECIWDPLLQRDVFKHLPSIQAHAEGWQGGKKGRGKEHSLPKSGSKSHCPFWWDSGEEMGLRDSLDKQ